MSAEVEAGRAAAARALADRVLAGDIRAGARLARLVDDQAPAGIAALALVHRDGPEAPVVGITGAPGSGKSTLTSALVRLHRAAGRRVGVVAVDPSSPVSGGAVLADRVRMQEHVLDDGVFIRSLAARGHHGGLSVSASATVRIMEAMGLDVVILETVGVGQSEVDVARVADTVVAVLTPGMGDDVQAMKAGLLEIPDVFAVNKADRDGADLVVRDLEAMLHLLPGDGAAPTVVKTVGTSGDGVDALAAAIGAHRQRLEACGGLAARRLARARLDLETACLATLRQVMLLRAGGAGALEAAARRVAARASDPWTEARNLLADA